MTKRETKFLELLGITGEDQDEVDVEYLQDVHWETWEATWRLAPYRHV